MSARLYKVCISAVDGESFYIGGGPNRADVQAFLLQHDHEGSSVTLEWMEPDGTLDSTDDSDRVYRILAGTEEP